MSLGSTPCRRAVAPIISLVAAVEGAGTEARYSRFAAAERATAELYV